MRLIFACVVGWFVLAIAAAVASADGAGGSSAPKREKSGSLIVAVVDLRP
jgi:hypothetical protein